MKKKDENGNAKMESSLVTYTTDSLADMPWTGWISSETELMPSSQSHTGVGIYGLVG
jgi:hypothetical protein